MKGIVTGIVVASSMAVALFAQGVQAKQSSGYLTDLRGAVVKDAFGLCWRTGYWTPAMATEECDPDLVPKKSPPPAKPMPPAPKPAPLPKPRPVMQKVTLSADTLFSFDKSFLRPAGKAKLDAFIRKLRGVDVETIIAVGYTDRIGTKAYNLKLSLRRAKSVQAYLISHGIAANRIHVEGKGEADPVTMGRCKRGPAKIVIKCLQPDRRVEIQLIGTRTR